MGLPLVWSAPAAVASPIFLGTLGPRSFRTDGINPAETFDLNDDIAAMAVGPDGAIWAISRSDDDHDGSHEIHTLQNPLGPDPTSRLIDEIGGNIGSHSAECFDGTHYILAQTVNGPLILGSLGPETSQFDAIQELNPRSDRVVSLVVLTKPDTLTALAVASADSYFGTTPPSRTGIPSARHARTIPPPPRPSHPGNSAHRHTAPPEPSDPPARQPQDRLRWFSGATN